jgi:HTH-type transcriptional regulator/antitoxin HigA
MTNWMIVVQARNSRALTMTNSTCFSPWWIGYESQHFPMGTMTPEKTIRVYMENAGLTRKDLEPMIGTRARVSEVLSGKRRLTLDMIRRLHEGLGIPLADLISTNIEGLQPTVRRTSVRNRKPAAKAKQAARAHRQPVRQAAG